jgi:hypothetical protein
MPGGNIVFIGEGRVCLALGYMHVFMRLEGQTGGTVGISVARGQKHIPADGHSHRLERASWLLGGHGLDAPWH